MSLTSDLKNTEWGKKERKKVREGGSEREERENEREREREREQKGGNLTFQFNCFHMAFYY